MNEILKVDPVLEVSNLQKSFDGRLVIDDVSFSINPGEVWGMIGNNGVGKTTIMRMIVNLVCPDCGSVIIDGYNIKTHYKEAVTGIGVCFEHQYYYENMTAFENMKIVYDLCKEDAFKPNAILRMVGLDPADNTIVRRFSTGMRQRLGLAFALINKPGVIMLDEPTNGLDPEGIRSLFQTIKTLSSEEKVAFLISSHMIVNIERICDGVIILKKGKVALNDYIPNIKKVYEGQTLEDVYFNLISGKQITVEKYETIV